MKYEEKLKTLFNLNHLAPSHLQVNKDIVSGLKYVQHTYRTGVKGKVCPLATVPNSASQGHINFGKDLPKWEVLVACDRQVAGGRGGLRAQFPSQRIGGKKIDQPR